MNKAWIFFLIFFVSDSIAEEVQKKLNAKGSIVYLLEKMGNGEFYQLTTRDPKGNRIVSLWQKGLPVSLIEEKVDFQNRSVATYSLPRLKDKTWTTFDNHIDAKAFKSKSEKIINARDTVKVEYLFDDAKGSFVEKSRQSGATGFEY